MTTGFNIQPENVKVFYEGRYMSIQASFEGIERIAYLKHHIAIDCFLGALELPPVVKEISSMVKVMLGDECGHQYFPVSCVALDETAAEKWVALTRRIVGSRQKERDSDKHLVRHLYDLYQLNQQNSLSDQYFVVVKKVLQKERSMFGGNISDPSNDVPSDEKLALHYLRSDSQWEEHWRYFLEQMVYQPVKPSFEQAVGVIEGLAVDRN